MNQEILKAALKWSLENGVVRTNYRGVSYNDSGCGCCAGNVDVPPEFVEILKEIFKDG